MKKVKKHSFLNFDPRWINLVPKYCLSLIFFFLLNDKKNWVNSKESKMTQKNYMEEKQKNEIDGPLNIKPIFFLLFFS